MNIEKMREEFEAWAVTSAYLGLGSKEDLLFDNADENGYDHPEVHLAWLGWQASRAAIEVNLPSRQDDGSEGVGYNKAIKDCQAAVEMNGLRVSK